MNSSTYRRKNPVTIGAGVAVLVGLTAVGAPAAVADASFDPSASTARVAGDNRYATAAQIAQTTWTTAQTVVVANGETNGIDAVSAAYLAGAVDAPVLLTRAGSVPAETAAAIAALDPEQVLVVGGEASVSAGTYDALTAGRTGERVSGANRYATAAEIAQAVDEAPTTVFLARGDVSSDQVAADALAATPVAFRAGVPVLLTAANGLPAATAEALEAIGPTSVVVLGGEGAVSAQVAAQAQAAAGAAGVTRLQGGDRTGTAAAIAGSQLATAAGFTKTGVAIANGYRIDALAAGPAAGKAGYPLLLTGSTTSIGSGTQAYLEANAATLTAAQVYGGTSAVSTAVAVAAARAGGNADPAGSSDVVALAEAFAATLDEDQRTALNQEYTFENAANWSNLPNGLLTGGAGGGGGAPTPSGTATGTATSTPTGTATGTPTPSGTMTGAPTGMPTGMPTGGPGGGGTSTGRVGLQTSELSEEQWTALEALLAAATGTAENEGFDEILQHLAADDYLGENGGGDTYNRDQYFIAFLGTPSDSGTWELQFGGHHLAVANTYVDGELAGATPSFRGIEPFETVEVDGVTVQPEQQEQAAFVALLTSLDETQLAAAELSSSYGDILLGPGEDWAFPTTSEGVKGSDLTAEQ
ncbi:cell wall-binding repeat-containing protein, partial [Kineococcus glutinatus]|uniref:cell wall-binding repeat-containing protein n=1 Tax=Kineococcus glutinatus TaxID=1070872 RepID=UPI0031EA12DD